MESLDILASVPIHTKTLLSCTSSKAREQRIGELELTRFEARWPASNSSERGVER